MVSWVAEISFAEGGTNPEPSFWAKIKYGEHPTAKAKATALLPVRRRKRAEDE
jgi:hypothetical protein